MCVCPPFQLLLRTTLRPLYEELCTKYGELVAEHTFKENNQKLIKSIQIKLVLIKTRSRHFNQQTSALFWKREQNMLQIVWIRLCVNVRVFSLPCFYSHRLSSRNTQIALCMS